MLRSVGLLLLSLAGCGLTSPCVNANLDRWCDHNESTRDTGASPGAAACDPPSSAGAVPTPDGDHLLAGGGGGYSGVRHYFDAATGDHVATEYWTDTNTYCGGSSYGYGTHL